MNAAIAQPDPDGDAVPADLEADVTTTTTSEAPVVETTNAPEVAPSDDDEATDEEIGADDSDPVAVVDDADEVIEDTGAEDVESDTKAGWFDHIYPSSLAPIIDTVFALTHVNGNPVAPTVMVRAGDVLRYTATSTNTGDDPGVAILVGAVPALTTYTGSGEGWTCPTGSAAGVPCAQLVIVPVGAAIAVTMTVTLGDPLPPTSTSVVNAITSTGDTCSICTVTNAIDHSDPGKADLVSNKTVTLVNGAPATSATLVVAGDEIVYEISTRNLSGVVGTTTIGDVVPEHTTYTGTGEGWSCTAPAPAGTACDQEITLGPGALTVLTFTVTVDDPLSDDADEIRNVATTTDGRCEVCETVNPAGRPDLETVKSVTEVNGEPASTDTVVGAGDVITYQLMTTNVGDAVGSTTLTDTVPDSTTYTGTGEGWTCVDGDPAGTACEQDVTVMPAESVLLSFTVTVDRPLSPDVTEIRNLATSSDGTCDVCEVVNPAGHPRLRITKTVTSVNGDPATEETFFAAGDVVGYEIVAFNEGDAVGTATLTDTVPVHTTYSGDGEGWSCVAGDVAGTPCEQDVTVMPSETVVLPFTVTVDDPLSDDVTEVRNLVTTSDGTCDACETVNPVDHPETVTTTTTPLVPETTTTTLLVPETTTTTAVAPKPELPKTGGPLQSLALTGMALGFLGLLAVGSSRRRRLEK